MYKIVLVVAVFAFALQGAFSASVPADAETAQMAGGPANSAAAPAVPEAKALPNDETPSSTTAAPTTPKTSGASSSEICTLLVQISSLVLVAKHIML